MPEYLDDQGRKRRYRLAVALVIVAAFGVRLMDLYRNYPYPMVWEETYNLGVCDLMVHSFSWVPVGQNIPSLELYPQSVALGVFGVWKLLWGEVGSLEAIHPLPGFGYSHPEVYLWGRLISVFFGTLSVYMTYLLARRFYGRRASLMSAGIMALAVLPVRHSALMTGYSLGTFLIVVTLILTSRLQAKRSVRRYMVTGLLLGLALSANLSAAWLAAPMTWAHLNRKGLLRPKWSAFFGALGLAAAVFVLFNPQVVLRWEPSGAELLARLGGMVSIGSPPAEEALWHRVGLMVFGFGGPAVAMLGVVGVALMVARLGGAVVLPALYFVPVLVAYLFSGDFRVTRLVSLFPLWSLAAGLGLSWFVCRVMPFKQWLRTQGAVEVVAVVVTWALLWLTYARLGRLAEAPGAARRIELFHLSMAAMLAAVLWQGFIMWAWEKKRFRNLAAYPGLLLMASAVALAVYVAVRLGLDPRYGWPFRLVYLALALGAVVLVMLQKQAGRFWQRWAVVVGMVLLVVLFNVVLLFAELAHRDETADTRLKAAHYVNRFLPEARLAVSDDVAVDLRTLHCDEVGRVELFDKTPGERVEEGWTHLVAGWAGNPLLVHLRRVHSWGQTTPGTPGEMPNIRNQLTRLDRAQLRELIMAYRNPAVHLFELRDVGWSGVKIENLRSGGAPVAVNPDAGGVILAAGASVSMALDALPRGLRLAAIGQLTEPDARAELVLNVGGKVVARKALDGAGYRMVEFQVNPTDEPAVLSLELSPGSSQVVLRKLLTRSAGGP